MRDHGGRMAVEHNADGGAVRQLGTRIGIDLYRRVRLRCAEADEPIMAFVARALENELKREKPRRRADGD